MLGFGKKKQAPQAPQPAMQQQHAVAPNAVQQPQPSHTTVQKAPPQQKGKASQKDPAVTALKDGSVSLVDIIAPSSVEVDFKHIRVGEMFYRTFFVVDYPREVSPNWLSILIDYKETMNLSMYIYPVESKDVLTNLRRKIAEMEASLQTEIEKGLEPDPKIQAALEDAMALREELAKGMERFFQFGLYVTLAATTVEELDQKSKELASLLASNLLVVKPATLQMEDGFKTTLPMGNDRIFITRNMDTTSVASTFPFTSYEISQPNGILFGVNTLNNSLVIVDRFAFENANEVVFGKSGAGKSFLVKLEVLRQMMFEAEVLIIDPEDEYRSLCHSLDGEYISFSKNSEVKINPFALLSEDQTEAQLGIKILSLHGLLKIMLGDMNPTQEAMLDRAIVLTYKQKGITPDPATYKNEPPILEDLYKTLLNMEEAEAKDIAFRLEKFVKGGFSGLFNQQTNYDVRNQLTVFSLKQLEDVLRPIAMHVILDFVWNRVRTKLKKRLLIVDEAWYLMKYPDSASFLQGIAKRARKYFLGVTTLTQDIEDFLSSDYGKAILSNSSVQILLKQNASEVDILAKTLNLSEGEKQFLLTAQVGEGLLFAGQNHITAQFLASKFEYDLITSKPQDIVDEQEKEAKANAAVEATPSEAPPTETTPSTSVPDQNQPLPTQTQSAPTQLPSAQTSTGGAFSTPSINTQQATSSIPQSPPVQNPAPPPIAGIPSTEIPIPSSPQTASGVFSTTPQSTPSIPQAPTGAIPSQPLQNQPPSVQK